MKTVVVGMLAASVLALSALAGIASARPKAKRDCKVLCTPTPIDTTHDLDELGA